MALQPARPAAFVSFHFKRHSPSPKVLFLPNPPFKHVPGASLFSSNLTQEMTYKEEEEEEEDDDDDDDDEGKVRALHKEVGKSIRSLHAIFGLTCFVSFWAVFFSTFCITFYQTP